MKSKSLSLFGRWIGASLIATVAIAPAAAQTTPDALKGRSLFMNGGFSVSFAGGNACASCHVVANYNINNVLNGSDEAHLRSKLGTGSMIAYAPLRPTSVPDATHIAAYLGNVDSWLAQNTLDFGAVAVNTDSAVKTVIFGNTSQNTLVITSVTIGGAAAANYTLQTGTGYCVAGSQSLPAGEKCLIALKFKPTATGARAATVSIKHNQPSDNTIETIAVTGTGGAATTPPVTPATLAWTTAATIDVGSTATGATGTTTGTMTIKNSGTAAVTISSVVLGGTNASEFSMTNGCSTTTALAAAASCSITIKSVPMTAGAKTATVTVTDSAAHVLTSTVTATATGSSTTASPVTGTSMSNEGGGGGAIGAGGAIEWLYAALLACATIALARNRVTLRSRR